MSSLNINSFKYYCENSPRNIEFRKDGRLLVGSVSDFFFLNYDMDEDRYRIYYKHHKYYGEKKLVFEFNGYVHIYDVFSVFMACVEFFEAGRDNGLECAASICR